MNSTNVSSIIPFYGLESISEHSPVLEIIEIVLLVVVSLTGTVGNLMVISSIILDDVVQKNGNIFLINLAVADLMISSVCIPNIIPNVINGFSIVPEILCKILAYFVLVSGACSLANMFAITTNRYWAIVRRKSYDKVFSKRNSYVMVLFTWIWANIVALPATTNGVGLVYDPMIAMCLWNIEASLLYNLFLMLIAISLPVSLDALLYYILYRKIKERGRWLRSMSCTTNRNLQRKHKSLQIEKDLLKTFATTVVVCALCWLPSGVIIMSGRPPDGREAYKILSWLALFNSSANFIIYGVLNPGYRSGYKHLLKAIFCRQPCKRGARNPKISCIAPVMSSADVQNIRRV